MVNLTVVHGYYTQNLMIWFSAFVAYCSLNQLHRQVYVQKEPNDWKNIAKILSNHEKRNSHITCFHEWKELELRLNKNKTIDDEYLWLMKQEEKIGKVSWKE
jgi:hypothetical protein